MAIPARGSRSLHLDGVDYRSTIRKRPTYAQGIAPAPMRLAIQQAGAGPRTVVVVDLGVLRPDNWLRPSGTGVTSAVVEDIVRAALASGWAPDRAGTPHRLDYQLVADAVGRIEWT